VHPWQAEHGVDAALARRMVAATWPDLASEAGADAEPSHVGSGWDVDVWRFGNHAVRFPRRALGIRCLDNELIVLPHVADRVPVAVPRPSRIGMPVLGYPARFYVHALLPGQPLIRTALDDASRAALAGALGAFLRALHAIPLAPLRAAGLRDDDRGDVARIAARGLAWLDEVALPPPLAGAARALLAGPMPEMDAAPVLVHGDFHAGNLLVDEAGTELVGVIDWGDCAAGDPAIDLAIGWSIVPPAARAAFLAAYGPVSPGTWARARIGAVSRQGLALLAWAHDLGDAAVVDDVMRSIARALG
jgi:aminoglycoside phosphotransferase (APT) family kinase protein